MNELTVEWMEKAEGDYATAERELRARRRPNYDAVCFHAQQAAEKYLKAFLVPRRWRVCYNKRDCVWERRCSRPSGQHHLQVYGQGWAAVHLL